MVYFIIPGVATCKTLFMSFKIVSTKCCLGFWLCVLLALPEQSSQLQAWHTELETTLGASEPSLSEYILHKYESADGSAQAFRTALQTEAGIEGVHVDRLHALIQTLKVQTAMLFCFVSCLGTFSEHHWSVRVCGVLKTCAMQNTRSGTDGKPAVHKPTVRMPVDAPIPGLAIPNTREYAKQQTLQILEETQAALADGEPTDSRTNASTQDHVSLANAPSDRADERRSRDERDSRSERDSDRDRGGRHSDRERGSRETDRGRGREWDRDRRNDRDRGGDRHRNSRSDRDSRNDYRERDRDRDRFDSRDRRGRGDRAMEDSHRNLPEAPEESKVYRGRVSNTTRHGAFVELSGFRGRVEGMCHISNLANRRVNEVSEVVKRGQEVWVKVLSVQPPQAGQQRPRIDLSIRDVDQNTGKDLLPSHGGSFAPGGFPSLVLVCACMYVCAFLFCPVEFHFQ